MGLLQMSAHKLQTDESVGKGAQWVDALATQPDGLSSILGIHTW